LIARAGGQPGLGTDEGQEFRIRLVSTDEPDRAPYEETETPRPSAPSKGVVLHRVAGTKVKRVFSPALEMNEKSTDGSGPQRLMVASLVPEYSPAPQAVPERRGPVQTVAQAAVEPRKSASDAPALIKVKPGQMLNGKEQPHSESPPAVKSAQEKHESDVSRPFGIEASSGATQPLKIAERQGVLAFLNRWKSAWEQKDLDRYVKMYHADFGQDKNNLKTFLQAKKRFFRKYREIRVEIDRVDIRKVEGQLVVKFIQTFRGDHYSDKGWKRMVLAGSKNKGFRVISEDWSPL
jgi:hypothetical protein